jgi:hypothetical protein
MQVYQTLILETLQQHRAQVQGPRSFPPPERKAEEARTRQFPVLDGKNKKQIVAGAARVFTLAAASSFAGANRGAL